MNLFKTTLAIAFGVLTVYQGGCGVKGDPVPPATPVEIGRGRPLYKPDDESNNAPALIRKAPTEQKDDRDTDE